MANGTIIIDDLLGDEDLACLDQMSGGFFPWTYQAHSDFEGDGVPQFVHIFAQNTGNFFHTEQMPVIHPLLVRIGVSSIISIKANLTPRSEKRVIGGWHTDREFDGLPDSYKDAVTTAVFYLNDNNGGTELRDGTYIESKRNRVAMFPCGTEHRAVRHTDGDFARIIVNINFIRYQNG